MLPVACRVSRRVGPWCSGLFWHTIWAAAQFSAPFFSISSRDLRCSAKFLRTEGRAIILANAEVGLVGIAFSTAAQAGAPAFSVSHGQSLDGASAGLHAEGTYSYQGMA